MAESPSDHVDALLEQWRRERPDLDVSALGLLARLFRVAHVADATLAEMLVGYGLQTSSLRYDAQVHRTSSTQRS
jgi:hypothetical protein